jgi:hypothetical protein
MKSNVHKKHASLMEKDAFFLFSFADLTRSLGFSTSKSTVMSNLFRFPTILVEPSTY